MAISIIYTNTGAVIGKEVFVNDREVTLEKPRAVIPTDSGVQLYDFTALVVESEMTWIRSNLAINGVYTPLPELANAYLESLGELALSV